MSDHNKQSGHGKEPVKTTPVDTTVGKQADSKTMQNNPTVHSDNQKKDTR